MGLETGTYISDLLPQNPPATDPRSQGADHLRLIKAVLKNTFPSIKAAVSASADDLNSIPTIQSTLSALQKSLSGYVPTAPDNTEDTNGQVTLMIFNKVLGQFVAFCPSVTASGNGIALLGSQTFGATGYSSLSNFVYRESDGALQVNVGSMSANVIVDYAPVSMVNDGVNTCVSGIPPSGEAQGLKLCQSTGSGRPHFYYTGGDGYLATYGDVTALQGNMSSAVAAQANTNSNLQSQINGRVSTPADNSDAVNGNVDTLLYNKNLGQPVAFNGGTGYALPFSQTYGAAGFTTISNMVFNPTSQTLNVNYGSMSSGQVATFVPVQQGIIGANGSISGGWWTKTGNILRQVIFLEKLSNDPTVTFPTAYSSVPCVTFGASTEYTTRATAVANIQRDANDNLLLSPSGCTLHIARDDPYVATSSDGVDVWMSIEGPVA